MFSWNLAKKLFDGFSILRWTDFIRPTEYVQMEKAASQAILSYIIGKEYEECTGEKLDWDFIIQSNIYGLLCKIATSDIKSTINNKIKTNNLEKLENYIVNYYFDGDKCRYEPQGLINKKDLETYIKESNNPSIYLQKNTINYQICYVAHKFATYREFCYIKEFNQLSPDKTKVENAINPSAIDKKISNEVLKNILAELSDDRSPLLLFYSYFEKLKPQIRWSQTCRLPQTTVLGHSLYVAILTYFTIKEMVFDEKNSKQLLINSFFAALFHDLPESLTRDIISPVKKSIEGLDESLSFYEYQEVKTNMIDRIKDKSWTEDFLMLLGKTDDEKLDVFTDKNHILGKLIKSIDTATAFIEARISVELGINSAELQKGIKNCSDGLINKKYEGYEPIDGKKIECNNTVYLNDFLASIPQYQEGVG